jgi:hypothetical protein
MIGEAIREMMLDGRQSMLIGIFLLKKRNKVEGSSFRLLERQAACTVIRDVSHIPFEEKEQS